MTYIRVRVLRTGHQIDVLAEHVDPARHDVISRFAPAAKPRRSKYRIRFRRTASVPAAVEGLALQNQAGTGEKEAGP